MTLVYKWSFLVVVLLWFTGCKTGEKEIHLIPSEYTGAVTINFDRPSGDTTKYAEDGSRIYTIPEDGVLNTQFKFNDGWVQPENIRFYYVKASGQRQKLSYVEDKDDLQALSPKDTVVYHLSSFDSGLLYFVCSVDSCNETLEKYSLEE